MAITSNVSFLGIAKETTVGTAVAPTNFLRVTSLKGTPHVSFYDDEGYRGSAVKSYGVIAGSQYGEYEFSGPVAVDEIGWAIAGILNDVGTSGTSAPFTHTFALLNSGSQQPTSYTLTDYNGNNARAWAGTRFDKLDLNFSADGLLDYTAHGQGMTFATTTNPTASFSTTQVVPNYKCTATLANVANVMVLDGSLSFARSIKPVLTLGAQNPTDMFAAGDLEVTGKLTLLYDTAAESALSEMLAGTQDILTLDWVQTAATAELKVVMSKATFNADGALDRPQGDFAKLPLSFKAVANTTDVGTSAGYSPSKVTLINALPSGTYK